MLVQDEAERGAIQTHCEQVSQSEHPSPSPIPSLGLVFPRACHPLPLQVFARLTSLQLYRNALTIDTVPWDSLPPGLHALDLGRNRLAGTLPAAALCAACPLLERLVLYENALDSIDAPLRSAARQPRRQLRKGAHGASPAGAHQFGSAERKG